VGIQCKLTIKAQKLKRGTIRREVTQALAFQPLLKEYIIATTADDDADAHAEAALVTNEQASLDRDFTVQVWGWQTLQTHILRYEAAIDAFSPEAFPHLRRLLKGQDKIQEQGLGGRRGTVSGARGPPAHRTAGNLGQCRDRQPSSMG
jgi:hypothetical protein